MAVVEEDETREWHCDSCGSVAAFPLAADFGSVGRPFDFTMIGVASVMGTGFDISVRPFRRLSPHAVGGR